MEELFKVDDYLSRSPSQYAQTNLHCPKCGREHKIPFTVVQAGENLIEKIPEIIYSHLQIRPEKFGIIYDRHIEDKLDTLFFEPFNELQLSYIRIPLGKKGLLLEAAVEVGNEAADSVPGDVDFLISVGSGVISDLAKWIATRISKPFMLVGTAASMNAYTSITGSMTENNVKTSKWLDPASAVLLDSELLASAPLEMTWAGIGDLLARDVANADWKLSEFVRGTYFCPVPFEMMGAYEDAFTSNIKALGRNEPSAMASLGDAILISGYSMTMLDGETSPSSGSEHILSHFFDFQHEVFDLPKHYHGTQVGLGTIIMSKAWEILRGIEPETLDIDDIEQRRLSQTAVNLDHRRVFGDYGTVFDVVVSKKRVDDIAFREYIQKIIQFWDPMWKVIDPYLVGADKIRALMEQAGAVTKLSEIDRTAEDGIQAMLYGSHYRSRYTILDLFWELGLFPELALTILEQSGVLD